jgi:hypothetical protein
MKRKLKANLQFNFNNVEGDTVKQVIDFNKWLQSNQTMTETEQKYSTLESVCIGQKEYESIKAWFIKEGLIDPETLISIDSAKGAKKALVSYMKDMYRKKYSPSKLSDQEIKDIAKNSFGIDISISTIKHTRPDSNRIILPLFSNR